MNSEENSEENLHEDIGVLRVNNQLVYQDHGKYSLNWKNVLHDVTITTCCVDFALRFETN